MTQDTPQDMPTDAAFKFCPICGQRIAFSAPACPHCGQPFEGAPGHSANGPTSRKSYGVAVALCGVFGIMGIHHFYIGNHLHGLLDVALCAGFILLIALEMPVWAFSVLTIDIIHTMIVFTRLIMGVQRDGQGELIRPPHFT